MRCGLFKQALSQFALFVFGLLVVVLDSRLEGVDLRLDFWLPHWILLAQARYTLLRHSSTSILLLGLSRGTIVDILIRDPMELGRFLSIFVVLGGVHRFLILVNNLECRDYFAV